MAALEAAANLCGGTVGTGAIGTVGGRSVGASAVQLSPVAIVISVEVRSSSVGARGAQCRYNGRRLKLLLRCCIQQTLPQSDYASVAKRKVGQTSSYDPSCGLVFGPQQGNLFP